MIQSVNPVEHNDRPMSNTASSDEADGHLIPTRDLIQIARGILMGGADVIPGVSGGTVALILGIYTRLVTAISHWDSTLVGHLTHRRWRAAWVYADLRWLGALLLGIAIGVAMLGSTMHYLLQEQRQFTLAAFFGLIAASSVLVARMIHPFRPARVAFIIAGGVFAFWLVQLPGLRQPPTGLPYVFLCGGVSICAMILPGISGSFVLLILGKYEDITGIVRDTLQFEVGFEGLVTAFVFAAGCLVGLVSFSRFLRWLLARHQPATMSVLCGFMIGSLNRIWPFQRSLPAGESYENLSLGEISFGGRFWATLFIAAIAAGVVFLLDWATAGHEHVPLEGEDGQRS
jgi:putative membrane protein